jgi:hypothetical protein
MLRKQDMTPGTVVHVARMRTEPPQAFGSTAEIPECVRVFTTDKWGPFYPHVKLSQGDNIVIVRRPRKHRNQPNLIRVRRGEVEGEAFWCELRAACELGFKS